MFENHYCEEVAAYREIRFRLCHQKQSQEGYLCAQGQYHETRRWPVFEKLRRGKHTYMILIRTNSFDELMNLQISKLYPRIQFEKMIVDNTTMQLVSNPHQVSPCMTYMPSHQRILMFLSSPV